MNTLKICIALLLIGKASLSQNSIKLSNQFTTQKVTWLEHFDSSKSATYRDYAEKTVWLSPTLAYQWKAKKKRMFHQIELNKLRFSSDDEYQMLSTDNQTSVLGGNKIRQFEFAIQFESMREMLSSASKTHQLLLGYGIQHFIEIERTAPYSSSQFPKSMSRIGFQLFLTPRYIYQFNKKFYLDLNAQLPVARAQFVMKDVHNPTIQLVEDTSNTFDFELFQRFYSARLGIGMNF